MKHNTILSSTTLRAFDARSAAIAHADKHGISWRFISTDLIEGRTIIRDQSYDVVAIIEVR